MTRQQNLGFALTVTGGLELAGHLLAGKHDAPMIGGMPRQGTERGSNWLVAQSIRPEDVPMRRALTAVALCATTVALTLGSAGFANAEAWIYPQACMDGGGQVFQIEPGLGKCVGGTYDGMEVQERP
ncbi:hypothetical protein [Kitasatospora sp. NPDC006786]|uniref:hypothetical protein n=1 Tax=unclassified Kitasatospora TaxID=2633591 RepID=UPI00340E8C19